MSITITHINIISRFTSALIGLARASFFIGHLSWVFRLFGLYYHMDELLTMDYLP